MVDPRELKRALVAAGFEVFRTRGDEIHLAERHNVSLMEAGVRVRGGVTPAVFVVARAQRSDASSSRAEQLFDLVRARLLPLCEQGFAEVSAEPREIRSVNDPTLLVDTWYEVTYSCDASDIEGLLRLAGLALRTDRYVVP